MCSGLLTLRIWLPPKQRSYFFDRGALLAVKKELQFLLQLFQVILTTTYKGNSWNSDSDEIRISRTCGNRKTNFQASNASISYILHHRQFPVSTELFVRSDKQTNKWATLQYRWRKNSSDLRLISQQKKNCAKINLHAQQQSVWATRWI